MSEEQEGGLSTVKKTVIGIVTTAVTAAGAYVTTHIEAIFGGEDEKTEQVAQPAQQAAPAPIVLNIENNNTQQQNNSGGGTTIIKETVREVPAQQPAAPVEEPKETNAERMARLKAKRAENAGGGN
jgi:hypothetical protein